MDAENKKSEEKIITRKVRFLKNEPAFIRRPLTLLNGHGYAAVWVHVELEEHEQNPELEDGENQEPKITYKRERFILRDDGAIFGELDAEGITPIKLLGARVELPHIPNPEKTWSTSGVERYLEGYRPEPKEVFQRTVGTINRFIDLEKSLGSQKDTAEFIACYVLGTWFSDAFTVIGYLWPNGQRGSGKTQLVSLIAESSYLGELILAGSTYASLRDMADYGATLAFDDAENYSGVGNLDGDKRALLLAGNRKGARIAFKELNGKKWETRYVNAYCPKLFTAINLPDPVLASRTIIIPLIRSDDDMKRNSDPADYDLWPHDRRELLDDMWALGLSHISEIKECENEMVERSRLSGRDLEPWRAPLSVALWLEKKGVVGLFSRMENLSWLYFTEEKPNFESDDLTALVIKGLASCAMSAISANHAIKNTIWFATKTITDAVVSIAKNEEADIDFSKISVNLVGKIMGSLRFSRKRPDGSKKRGWDVSLRDLRRNCDVYGVHFPDQLDTHKYDGINGLDGTSGTNHEDTFWFSNNDNSKRQIQKPCNACGQKAWKERPQEKGGGWYCSVCHPKSEQGLVKEEI